jgi:hypothetical protein
MLFVSTSLSDLDSLMNPTGTNPDGDQTVPTQAVDDNLIDDQNPDGLRDQHTSLPSISRFALRTVAWQESRKRNQCSSWQC